MDGVDKQGEEGEVMTVIYVDTLFLLNALVDYLLLLCAARLAGEPLKRLRFALGAVLGGGYAVAIFLPGLGFLERPACRLAAAVLMVLSFVQGTNTVYTRLLLAALAAVSFFCVMQTAQNSFKGLDRGKYSFTLLMPAYTCCVWLIAAYQVRAGDPVQLDYVYELFAIIASLLGLYFHAGFSFERGRVFWAGLFSLLGIYFCLTTLADQHDLATTLLYGFAILYLLSSTVTLLYNAGRPELLARAENDTTEGTPDES